MNSEDSYDAASRTLDPSLASAAAQSILKVIEEELACLRKVRD